MLKRSISLAVLLDCTLLALLLFAVGVPTTSVQAAMAPSASMAVDHPSNLLQFEANGHMLGFQSQQLYLASLDHALRVQFLGTQGVTPQSDLSANKTPSASGPQPLGRVSYSNLWDGISVTYESAAGGIAKSTYLVAPGANTGQIQLRYNATANVQPDGSLQFQLAFGGERGILSESAPIAGQEVEGRPMPVPVSFRVSEAGVVGFKLGTYDPRYPLTIDPSYEWHTFYGSSGSDSTSSIAVDDSGNIYIAGYSFDTWQGDGGVDPLHPLIDYNDIVVLKLSSNGSYQWHTFYGPNGASDAAALGIAVDSSGDVYVTGISDHSWQGDGGANPLHPFSGIYFDDIVVLKLSSSGAYQWHTFYGAADADDYAHSIAVDDSGNVYVVGGSRVTWQGDGGANPLHPFSGQAPFVDMMILKLTSDGAYAWHTFYGSVSNDGAYGIAVDGAGSVCVTGMSGYTWQGDNAADPLHPFSGGAPEYDLVVLKLTSSGAYAWHTFYGSSSGSDYGYGIAVDSGGNVYIAGNSYAQGSWQGNGGAKPLHPFSGGNPNSDIVVLKLAGSGEYAWHTFYGSYNFYGSGNNEYGRGIAVDGTGNVYITGYSQGTWQGDGGANPLHPFSSGICYYGPCSNMTILRLTSSGAYRWHTFYGSYDYIPDSYCGAGIAPDRNANVYVAGCSGATWQGDGGANPLHPYSGPTDIAVLKLSDPAGPAVYLPFLQR